MIIMVGTSNGSVMRSIICSLEAPSIRAASYKSSGIPVIAARKIIDKYPAPCQTRITVRIAGHNFDSNIQLTGSMPRFCSQVLSIGSSPPNMDWTIIPTTIQDMKYGRKMSDCETLLKYLLRISLNISAISTAATVVKKINSAFSTKVLRRTVQKSSEVKK
ncbi:hypothetical protein D3C76_1083340 [compost metagenome]